MKNLHLLAEESLSPIERDTLVAVVNSDTDLERFTTERWYRLPDRSLGKTVSASLLEETSTLALYHTQSITHGLPGAVQFFGTIHHVESMPRRDLIPDEPDHPAAEQLYHQIVVSSVESLAMPILNRRPRRVTFIRTNRKLLESAREVGDLYLATRAEQNLLAQLHDRDIEIDRRVFMQVREQLVEVDFGLYRDDSVIGVQCGETLESTRSEEPYGTEVPAAWNIVRFTPRQVESNLDRCIERIMAAFGESGTESRSFKRSP